MRKLIRKLITASEARAMVALRKTHSGGGRSRAPYGRPAIVRRGRKHTIGGVRASRPNVRQLDGARVM